MPYIRLSVTKKLTKEKGLLDVWNKSQVYFGFSPTLVTDDMERR